MPRKPAIPDLRDAMKKKVTRREQFLAESEAQAPSVRVSPRKIIDALSSTKNKAGRRDPEMSSTKKGNDWYFGSEEDQKVTQWINFPTSAHIGVDVDSGVTHSLETSTARRHDSQI